MVDDGWWWLMMVDDGSLVGGWPTPLKNDGVKVSWDDDFPNIMGKLKFMFQTTNQLETIKRYLYIYI